MASSPYLWSWQDKKTLSCARQQRLTIVLKTTNWPVTFLKINWQPCRYPRNQIQVELFTSQQQHIMQPYCSKHMNNAFRFFWKAIGLAYTNPPFSLLAKVLTKIAYEGGRVVMCTPD